MSTAKRAPASRAKAKNTHVDKENTHSVSSGNPCPFLRALVASGHIDGHQEPLAHIKDVVAAARGGTVLTAQATGLASGVIALFANGFAPTQMLHNLTGGFAADALRGGPLDKQGAGSGILDAQGQVNTDQLDRLDTFALDKTDVAGATERGLGAEQLKTMMDANFARAAGARRLVDRALMDGEWPVLLLVMGKPSADGAYLSVTELRTLFVQQRLPQRVLARLDGGSGLA
ncbi:MAG: hypothetical protein RIR09_133 [Pseudomonadota bacterium]